MILEQKNEGLKRIRRKAAAGFRRLSSAIFRDAAARVVSFFV